MNTVTVTLPLWGLLAATTTVVLSCASVIFGVWLSNRALFFCVGY